MQRGDEMKEKVKIHSLSIQSTRQPTLFVSS